MSYYNTNLTFTLLNDFLAKNLDPGVVLQHPMVVDWLKDIEEEINFYNPERKEYLSRKLNKLFSVIKINTDQFKERLLGTLPRKEKLCS